MRYLLFDDMSRCTETEVDRMLPLVSTQRRENALKYKHLFGQWAELKSWLMLQELIGEDVPNAGQAWHYNQYGKPYIAGGLEFSVSHCKQGIAVAIDKTPIGIDIESIREVKPELVHRTMNETEQRIIGDSATLFTVFWTRKEAFLKYKGTGIIDDLQHVLENTEDVTFETIIKPTYICTICYRK